MDTNPQTFSQGLVMGELVKYFNALPEAERTISATDVPLYNIKVAEKPNGKLQFVVGDLGIDDIYVGEATYTWVGARGTKLIATSASFFEIAKYIAPLPVVDDFQLFCIEEDPAPEPGRVLDAEYVNLSVQNNLGNNPTPPDFLDNTSLKAFAMHTNGADEIWMANPFYNIAIAEGQDSDRFVRMRPVYSMEQFVFNFPTITQESYGWIEDFRIFCQMVSLKRLVFDDRTNFAFTYNNRHPLTNKSYPAHSSQLSFDLIWSPSRHTAVAPPNPGPGEMKVLTIKINPFIVDDYTGTQSTVPFEVEQYTSTIDQFKNGVSGLFYWTTGGEQLPEPYLLDGLTLTMLVKVVNIDYDLATPIIIEPLP